MGKMSITSYTDENFSSESHSALALPVNSAKVKLTKGIRYAEDKQLGSLNGSNAYVRYRPETFYFECLFDMTNAMEDDDEKQPVHDLVDALEERLYDYNTEGHRPSFVKVEYGDITCTTTTPKGTVPRSSRWSMATSPSTASSRRWRRNTPCSTRTASRSAPN